MGSDALTANICIDRTAGLPLEEAARKRAEELSQSFEVMFRMFGQKVFSPRDMQTFESTLNVAKAELVKPG